MPISAEIQKKIEEAKENSIRLVSQAADQLRDGSLAAANQIDRQAKTKPWYFVALTAFFTMIFGFFMGRKSKRSRR